MAINRNAFLRYKVLDQCFRNNGRRYYIEDLLNEVNDALSDDNPYSSGIQLRQLREDLKGGKSLSF